MKDLVIFIIIHTIIALAISLPMGVIHEYLHQRKAKQLGYKVVKSNLVKNETIVNVTDKTHIKQIARAPYYYLVPLNLIILIIGIYLMHIGIMVGGGSVLLLHTISYPLEGKDEKKRKD